MIVLILAVIWIAALTPFALRKLSEHQATSSVTQFHHLSAMFGERPPAQLSDEVDSPSPARQVDEARLARDRGRLRHKRRRRTVLALCGFGVFTLAFGAIPTLRPMWDLTIIDVILITAYGGLLVYFTRREQFESERRAMRNVYPFLRPAEQNSTPTAIAAVGGSSSGDRPDLVPLRPAFRIVEAPD